MSCRNNQKPEVEGVDTYAMLISSREIVYTQYREKTLVQIYKIHQSVYTLPVTLSHEFCKRIRQAFENSSIGFIFMESL